MSDSDTFRSYFGKTKRKTYIFHWQFHQLTTDFLKDVLMLLIHFWSGKLDHRMLMCYRECSLSFQGCFSAVDQRGDSASTCPCLCSLCCCDFWSRLILLSILSFCFLLCLRFYFSQSMMWFSLTTWSFIVDLLSSVRDSFLFARVNVCFRLFPLQTNSDSDVPACFTSQVTEIACMFL